MTKSYNYAYGTQRHVYESLMPEPTSLSIREYLSKFIKAPITTLENEELKTGGAVISLVILPISMLLSIWSLIRSLINFRINSAFKISRLVEVSGLFEAEQMRARAMAEINWLSISLSVLLIFAVWFALMLFIPMISVKFSKYSQPVQFKKVFSQIATIAVPMSLLFLIATAFGFISFGLWLLPIVVSLTVSLLLHFIAIRRFFPESPNKAFYITIVTQVVFVIITQQVLNAQIDNVLINIMSDIIWN